MGDSDCNHLRDPFQHVVTIPKELCAELSTLVDDALDASVSDIITRPALVIQSLDTERLYYLRQYTFSTTVLLKARKENGHYTAYDFLTNPSSETMRELIVRAKILSTI